MSYYHQEPQPPPYSEFHAESNTESQEQLEEKNFIQQTTQWIPQNPHEHILSRNVRLEKPIVIPRLAVHGMMSSPLPFLRAYSPALRQLNVNIEEFTAFIDNLTIVQTEPVPLQALNLVGTGIGFIPWHWALAAGLSMNAAAIAGSKLTIRARTKRYLATVNREYFEPRGLKASLYKNDDVSALVGYPMGWPELAPAEMQMNPVSMRDRRMQALAPYIAPLSLDVPAPVPQDKMLDKLSAKLIAHTIAKEKKDTLKKQRKLAQGEVSYEEFAEEERKDVKKVKKMDYIVIENLRRYQS
ncbi:hypothetical protein BGW36DRAFT_432635 [Talaromyces proteolyticus]|uniref:Uncharacterized protein n=1 Tax=Talaromyces proteolyticus TaxID=1131652 RepID=A0AAD4KLI9_9EURO|nr:uncharacterized protein BGW36DRAFT_432635 [Talaromyces proteolyticus]KAH8690856.1 hypothetical protein BGW36DRAFT_432635 [Talaromyces proteolyticus]